MDSSSNATNRLIVLVAVALGGAAASQYLSSQRPVNMPSGWDQGGWRPAPEASYVQRDPMTGRNRYPGDARRSPHPEYFQTSEDFEPEMGAQSYEDSPPYQRYPKVTRSKANRTVGAQKTIRSRNRSVEQASDQNVAHEDVEISEEESEWDLPPAKPVTRTQKSKPATNLLTQAQMAEADLPPKPLAHALSSDLSQRTDVPPASSAPIAGAPQLVALASGSTGGAVQEILGTLLAAQADPNPPANPPSVKIVSINQGTDAAPTTPNHFNKVLKISVELQNADSFTGSIVLLANGLSTGQEVQKGAIGTPFAWTPPKDGRYEIQAALKDAGVVSNRSEIKIISFQTVGPKPIEVYPRNLVEVAGKSLLRVSFDRNSPLLESSIKPAQFTLKSTAPSSTAIQPESLNFVDGNVVEVGYGAIPVGTYTFAVTQGDDSTAKLLDIFGNELGQGQAKSPPFTYDIVKPVGGDVPVDTSEGLKNFTGPFVTFEEYTKPRKLPTGFNPSDKVVTRVARLYYFRDAHRVVQIINRDARSFNRQAVDMQQQLLDNARRNAENATSERQASERAAIQAASRARAAEKALNQFQQALATSRQQLGTINEQLSAIDPADTSKSAERTKLQQQQTDARTQVTAIEQHVNSALSETQSARDQEADKRELSAVRQSEEDRNQAELFRREVAAAKEDPDTYAPGKPDSLDPIQQVSLSVIGEGLIQMRGPMKGVNMVRTLINQIDAPVGQVRVAIHTVQVNGEHGKRMEPVIGRIQRYVDHSRFLTTQSGQMLRNAVTLVASRRAEQAIAECDQLGQQERDQKYVAAFFGKEFLDELRTLDSEFLHSGNKLLSVHSMDSTSLASALFLLALAKNDVRQEILCEFERSVTGQLPLDEQEYFVASTEPYKFGPLFHKTKFQFLGHNAKFVSLKVFFNAEVSGADTLNPMQREFIRLAQIFKSRLVTEIELQQRVMERALIEERIVSGGDDQKDALNREKMTKETMAKSVATRRTQQLRLAEATRTVQSVIASQRKLLSDLHQQASGVIEVLSQDDNDSGFESQIQFMEAKMGKLKTVLPAKTDLLQQTDEKLARAKELLAFFRSNTPEFDLKKVNNITADLWGIRTVAFKVINKVERTHKKPPSLQFKFTTPNGEFTVEVFGDDNAANARITAGSSSDVWDYVKGLVDLADKADTLSKGFVFPASVADQIGVAQMELKNARDILRTRTEKDLPSALACLKSCMSIYDQIFTSLNEDFATFEREALSMKSGLAKKEPTSRSIDRWIELETRVLGRVTPDSQIAKALATVSSGFQELLSAETDVRIAKEEAEESRHPLDHKKFLDMLIDDVEDKFIELMEGTRAHTANIDNYLSRLGQALDDDFQTQFYNPAFKGIREAGRYWDVQMGQIETTTVLTNNRTFAKVSPQATMEFDLPKRDILINEAFKSAQAAYDDYGALLGDPTFLSLSKMYRGQSPAATFGSGESTPTTRNVLPGLPSSTDESLVAQNKAASPDFPSALESLIPDPAIYKFETGTGYEIRPVIQPDGQAVVFHFNYMYTTNIREPVRADEKHLGRVRRHFIDTDVQTGNYELREVSRYLVALKASRTSRGVPLLEDLPAAGILFRPLPSQESSLQQNLILAQTVIFPTLFDLMGLRWAPAVADLDAMRLQEADFVTRGRQRALRERVFDFSSQQVDDFMRIPPAERRGDLYRSQETTPSEHPNGYIGPGMKLKDGVLREGYVPEEHRPESRPALGTSGEGAVPSRMRRFESLRGPQGPAGPAPVPFAPPSSPSLAPPGAEVPPGNFEQVPPSPVTPSAKTPEVGRRVQQPLPKAKPIAGNTKPQLATRTLPSTKAAVQTSFNSGKPARPSNLNPNRAQPGTAPALLPDVVPPSMIPPAPPSVPLNRTSMNSTTAPPKAGPRLSMSISKLFNPKKTDDSPKSAPISDALSDRNPDTIIQTSSTESVTGTAKVRLDERNRLWPIKKR